ncbi:aldehyde oxygenase (deformylating) [Oculatella sp. LEGE 06141]|uniref:aldehyde oxygenase (deformylating) n=1 Tax=Oculatella sp. LEGE 06141 TaxID=1828648 RepID=UPI00187E167B|nr:aldehyde oxygenase (deformylating) [Oculatella sp. LEGE 06141]
MAQSQTKQTLDFYSDIYRNAFSRINGIVIEGEQEAYDNFICLSKLMPDHAEELTRLGKMEFRHRKSFEACGRNLDVLPDLTFAQEFFKDLRATFQNAVAHHQIATCLLIQALVIECFAIAAYNNYIPVADDFARKVTESVVADEYLHLNFGEVWLKAHFEDVKAELETANRQILPLIWQMLSQVESDANAIGMSKQFLIEEFLVRYSEALSQLGFSTRDILRMSSQGLAARKSGTSNT